LEQIIKLFAWFFGWLVRRPKLKICISEDEPNREEGGLIFEVENQSNTSTSLITTIDVSFVTVKRQPAKMKFDVRELDRSLQPFTAKVLSASAREIQPERGHGWFRTYTFRPSKGPATMVRLKKRFIGGSRFI